MDISLKFLYSLSFCALCLSFLFGKMILCMTYIWATSWENLLYAICEQQRCDQLAHPRSLISVFVIHCLDSIILLFLYLKFQASTCLLWLSRLVWVLPGCKPRRQVFSWYSDCFSVFLSEIWPYVSTCITKPSSFNLLSTVKILKILTHTENIVVIILKFEQRDFTIEKCVQKM